MKRNVLARFSFAAAALVAAALLSTEGRGAAREGSAAEPPYETLLYQNTDMNIFDVALPAGQSALLAEHDALFVATVGGSATLAGPGQSPSTISLAPGAVLFLRGGLSRTLTNGGRSLLEGVTIEFLKQGLAGGGCSCSGGTEASICGCPNARPLPPDWEMQMGGLALAGMELAPGATYQISNNRTTRFLVAVTPFDLLDTSIHEPHNVVVRLPAGRFHWLAPGPHTLQNLGSQPLQLVSVEFFGTPQKTD